MKLGNLIQFSESCKNGSFLKKDITVPRDIDEKVKNSVIELKNGYFYWNTVEFFRDDAKYIENQPVLHKRERSRTSNTIQKVKRPMFNSVKQEHSDIVNFVPRDNCKNVLEEPLLSQDISQNINKISDMS